VGRAADHIFMQSLDREMLRRRHLSLRLQQRQSAKYSAKKRLNPRRLSRERAVMLRNPSSTRSAAARQDISAHLTSDNSFVLLG